MARQGCQLVTCHGMAYQYRLVELQPIEDEQAPTGSSPTNPGNRLAWSETPILRRKVARTAQDLIDGVTGCFRH